MLRALGSKLTALGMGDLLKKRIGIEHTGQPSKPVPSRAWSFPGGPGPGHA
jgi:hypothetical protein